MKYLTTIFAILLALGRATGLEARIEIFAVKP